MVQVGCGSALWAWSAVELNAVTLNAVTRQPAAVIPKIFFMRSSPDDAASIGPVCRGFGKIRRCRRVYNARIPGESARAMV
jgi:hypothetical protein